MNIHDEIIQALGADDNAGEATRDPDYPDDINMKQQQDAAEHDAWFRRQVQIGLDSANAGDLVPSEEVEAEAAAWRAETRRKIAGGNS